MIASQELDREQSLQPLAETISLALDLPVSIWLTDKAGESLHITAAAGLPDDYLRQTVLHLSEPCVASAVFATGQTIVVANVASDERWKYKTEAAAVGLKTAIVVPLRVKRKIIGVLDVYTRKVREFSDFEKTVIERFAAQAAVTRRRIRDMETLNEVSLLISSKPGSADLFERIMTAAQAVLDCQHVSIFLMDKSGDLVLKASSSKGVARERFALGEGLTGWVAEAGQAKLVHDAVRHPRFVPGLSSKLTERSMLVVPILLEGDTKGVISADMDGLNGFDEHDQVLLEAVASQAALALRNAGLFQQTRRQLEQRRILNEISELLMEKRGVQETVKLLTQRVLQLFNVNHGSFWSIDHAHQQAHLIFSIGQSGDTSEWEEKASDLSIALEQDSIVSHTARTHSPDLWNDVSKCPYWDGTFDKKTGYRTKRILTAPLLLQVEVFEEIDPIDSLASARRIIQQRATGVLQLVNTMDDTDFTEEDQEFLMSIARMAAIALYNAEMHEREMALSEIGHKLTAGSRLEEQDILVLIHEQSKKLMDTDNMYIALYDEVTDTVRFPLAFVDSELVHVRTRKAGKGRTEEIIRAKKPLFHPTAEQGRKWYEQPGHKEYIGRKKLGSWLGVPMMVGAKALGVIATYHPERDYVYSCDDLGILWAMANQAAIALDNATLYYDVNQRLEEANLQLERRVEDLGALNKVGQALSARVYVEEAEVLESVYAQVHQLTGTRDMYIALYDSSLNQIRFGLAMEAGERVEVSIGGWDPRPVNLESQGRTEQVILTKKPLLHNTLAEAEKWYKEPGHEKFQEHVAKSWLGVPMVLGGEALGVIALYDWEREHAYDAQFMQVVQSMADYVAIALEKARLQDEIVATQQLATLGTAIAALQHRINNTFNIIVPNVMRLRNRVDMTDGTTVEILDIIDRNARYTSDIITRIQEPLREVEAQDVDVNAVLNEVVGNARELQEADPSLPPIEFKLELEYPLPQVRAPIGQVTEVFQNLVDNACHAMKEGGRLTVTSHLTDSRICVRVQDTGPGISPQIQQRLFIKPVPSKEPGGGAGLGLWLSRLILQSIGSDVKIEKSDSTGTAMLVEIPASRAGKNREVRL